MLRPGALIYEFGKVQSPNHPYSAHQFSCHSFIFFPIYPSVFDLYLKNKKRLVFEMYPHSVVQDSQTHGNPPASTRWDHRYICYFSFCCNEIF